MTIAETLLPEFDEEMRTTRRVLERVPSEKGEWKPHEKSFSIAHLAQLVSGMPGWLTRMITATDLDLAAGPGYSTQPTAVLLETFDRNVREARAVIENSRDSDYEVMWTLRMGEKPLASMPRRVVVRQTINHLVHHRGQLTVYLRLLDVPVPSIYGPTADERMF
jgi:uncharacterized damage-inducible protein DinB